MERRKSEQAFRQAKRFIPGGVNSPVRAFGAVGGSPVFLASGRGAFVRDVDGHRYLDYVGSWGPLILGHAPKSVLRAMAAAARRGTTFGAPTENETALVRILADAHPSLERARLVSSGTEAAMSAIRVARGFTGRDLILKFRGCYHGHADGLLVEAGSGAATFGVPTSAGVPKDYAKLTLVCEYNGMESVRAAFTRHGKRIAAVIVEPVAGNMGVVPPAPGFLEGLRAITRRHRSLLIFDEVITGFRVAWGGAERRYGVRPDMAVLGKIIGGGMPLAAFGGRRDVMGVLAPGGPVYQAGTLSGNPVAVAAGIAALTELRRRNPYPALEKKGRMLAGGLREAGRKAGVALTVNRVGSMMTVFFTPGPVTDYESAARSDRKRYARYFHAMLDAGIHLPPSALEAFFVSAAHTQSDIKRTIQTASRCFTS
ncbi:MAG: glutamate-1-semialdehyde 2,1-aminomutase [Planctomycetota bacterium]